MTVSHRVFIVSRRMNGLLRDSMPSSCRCVLHNDYQTAFSTFIEEEQNGKFHLVLIDGTSQSEGECLDFLEDIRTYYKRIHILYMFSVTNPAAAQEALLLKARIFEKPFVSDLLREEVQFLLSQKKR